MSDAQIVNAILSGDTSQYETLVERYLGLVRSVCGSYEYEQESREDLIQDTFIEGYMHLNRLRDASRFGPWVAQIARNKCKSWVRKQSRRREGYEQLAVQAPGQSESNLLSEVSKREMVDWVRGAIHKLPLKTREAMLLFYVEGYSIDEAARCLSIRESAIKKRLQYGRELIGEQLCTDLREVRGENDSKAKARSIVTALPLASAPWLAGGSASATGILGGLGGGASWWITGGVAAVLLCVAAITVPALLEDESRVTEPTDSFSSTEDISGIVPDSPIAQVDDFNTLEDTNDDGVEDGFDETGSLTVRAVYYMQKRDTTEGNGIKYTYVNGPPVPGVTVKATPTTASINPQIIELLSTNGFTEEEIRFFRAKVIPKLIDTFSKEDISRLRETMGAKLNLLQERDVDMPEEIVVYTPSPQGTVTGVANEAGVCEFQLPVGYSYRIEVIFPGEEKPALSPRSNTRYVEVSAARPVDTTIALWDSASTIKGIVLSKETGEALKHVNLTLKGEVIDGRESGNQTDEKGFFNFRADMGYGAYELSLDDDTHYIKPVHGIREAGIVTYLTIEVEENAAIYGRVLNADGTPTEGVSIMRQSTESGSASGVSQSDEKGRYRAPHDGGIVTLYANKLTTTSEKVTFELLRDESLEYDFILPPYAEAYFTIHNDKGVVPDTINLEHVQYQRVSGSTASIGGNLLEKQADNRFVLSKLIAGEYGIWMYIKGYEPEQRFFEVDESLSSQAIDVSLTPATLTATLLGMDERGNAMGIRTIGVYEEYNDPESKRSSSATLMSVTSNEEGLCRFEGLWPGTFNFSYQGEGLSIALPHTEEIRLTIKAPLQREYQVNKRDIALYTESDPERPLSTDSAALFVITPSGEIGKGSSMNQCDIGENEVYCIKAGYTAGYSTISVSENGKRSSQGKINISLGEPGSIYGVIQDESGNSLEGEILYVYPARVWENMTGKMSDSARTVGQLLAQNVKSDSNGGFFLDYLPEGSYYVCIRPHMRHHVSGDLPDAQWAGPFDILPGHETGPVSLRLGK